MKFRLNKVMLPIEIASEKAGVLFDLAEKVPVIGGLLKTVLVLVVVSLLGIIVLLGMASFVFVAFFLNDLATGG